MTKIKAAQVIAQGDHYQAFPIQWISTANKFPAEETYCWVCDSFGEVYDATYDGSQFYRTLTPKHIQYVHKITFWMPYCTPEPPESIDTKWGSRYIAERPNEPKT